MEIPQHILDLIEKYLASSITKEELMTLNAWYHAYDDSQAELDKNPLTQQSQGTNLDQTDLEAALSKKIYAGLIGREELRFPKRKIRPWKNYAAAIALLILLGGSGYFFLNRNAKPANQSKLTAQQAQHSDLAPGGNKARLTLADGSVVILDSLHNGSLGQQGGTSIQKLDNGQLAYYGANTTMNHPVVFNKISTPRGGTYQIILADGTKVWLNAATVLSFPTSFPGQTREVRLDGEAYFEVAKNKEQPFLVHTATQTIKVLGTHFDVNAYKDEPATRTTLLEGKVQITTSSKHPAEAILSPGWQAVLQPPGKITVRQPPDLDQVTGWKDGFFVFHSTDFKTILRLISRWYDADIEYKGSSNPVFTGQISKALPVSKVFALLSLTNEVHYKIQGNKIIVSSK